MARHGVLGNGNSLALFDEHGYMRDFYYPYAGLENHIVSAKHRIALSVNGRVYFLDTLNPKLNQNANTLKFSIKASIEDISIKIDNVIYNEKDILLKRVSVKNLSKEKKHIRIFFNQEFKIKENKYRNTGYYYPPQNCVIHYRGNRVFVASLHSSFGGLDDYTIGLFDYEGKKGSYLNCFDNTLSKNSIEHGPVDSVIAKSFEIEPNTSKILYYTLVAETKIKNALKLQKFLEEKTPKHIYKSTVYYWKAWKNQNPIDFLNLPIKIKKLFYKSMFVIKTHCDKKTGGILASGDSEFYVEGKDNYAYVWARDAYFPAIAFDLIGFHNVPLKLFSFFEKVITKEGYINQKFEQNRSLGSSWHPYIDSNNAYKLPIQEDETAAVVNAVYNHFEKTRDVEFLESYYTKLVKNPSDFMCDYFIYSLSLPKPSYDIWEEKYIISTYTVCSVISALKKAATLSKKLGKKVEYEKYWGRAEEFKKGLIKNLYVPSINSFIKGVGLNEKSEITNYDVIADSSTTYALWYYGILDLDDEMLKNTIKYHQKLLKDDILVARFEGDVYFSDSDTKENPWIISTLWNLQLKIQQAKSKNDLLEISELLNRTVKLATQSGILPEQIDIKTKLPKSYEPLIWSHATFIETVYMYLKKYAEINPIN